MTRREELAQARRVLAEASGDPVVGPCDDAWHTAAIFAGLVDELAAALREWMAEEPPYRMDFTPAERMAWQQRDMRRWVDRGPGIARKFLSDLGPDA